MIDADHRHLLRGVFAIGEVVGDLEACARAQPRLRELAALDHLPVHDPVALAVEQDEVRPPREHRIDDVFVLLPLETAGRVDEDATRPGVDGE